MVNSSAVKSIPRGLRTQSSIASRPRKRKNIYVFGVKRASVVTAILKDIKGKFSIASVRGPLKGPLPLQSRLCSERRKRRVGRLVRSVGSPTVSRKV